MKMTEMNEGSQLRKLIHSFNQARHQFNHVTVQIISLFIENQSGGVRTRH